MRISATGSLTEDRRYRLTAFRQRVSSPSAASRCESAASNCPARHSRPAVAGFSLVELLVVVFIIGLFAGAAMLSLSVAGPDRELERESFRLRTLLNALLEEAVLETRNYGVVFTQRGYRFVVYDYQRLDWLEPAGDYLLREHRFAEPLELILIMEERQVALASELEPAPLERPVPQVLLLASGEMTPFEAQFYRDPAGGRYVLTGTLDGALEVTSHGFDGS